MGNAEYMGTLFKTSGAVSSSPGVVAS